MTIRDRVKKLIRVKASDLKPNPRNWRTHPAGQKRAMAAALSEIGFADAVLAREVDGGLELIDGHLRRETAADESVPVLVLDVTADEADKLLATLDPLASMATTDAGKLSDLLSHVTISDKDLQQVANETAAAAGIGGDEMADGLTDPDEVPDAPEPITKPGDLWLLGDHRVLCGDSTNEADVGRLGSSFDLCMTDPPYGADISYDTHDDTQAALKGLVDGFFPIVKTRCKVVALTPGINNVFLYPKPDWLLCWFYGAGTGRSPWGFSAWQPFAVWGKCPKLAAGEGCHPDGFQWPSKRSDMEENRKLSHACPKPMTVWARFMERLTNKETETIFDPFLGSGTTLIAAEQLGRKCYGLEISPQYCDVIVKRWENFTGNVAERVSAGTEAVANG